MGIDWIDDLLQKCEGLPVLGGIAHDLRFAYEILRVDPPDPQPVRNQTNALDNLHSRASALLSSYNESLLTLRQNWSGNVADTYFGPEVTAFEVEHDMEPSTTGVGYQLWNRFNQITSLLEYNHAAHQSAVDTLVQIQNLHGDLQTQVLEAAGLLLLDEGEADTGVGAVLDVGTVPLTAERVGAAVETTDKIIEIGEEVKDVQAVGKAIKTGITLAQIAKLVGGAIGAIVGAALLALLFSSDSSHPMNSLNPPATIGSLTDEQVSQLARQFGVDENVIRELMKEHPDWTLEDLRRYLFMYVRGFARKVGNLRTEGLTLQDIDYLLAQGFTADQIAQLLDSWKQLNKGYYLGKGGIRYNAGTLRELLDMLENPNTDPTNLEGAWRHLVAIMQVGPTNISAISVYINGVDGSDGEIDIVLKNGDVIEVGGDKSPTQLQNQHNRYQQFLNNTGGQNTYFYGDPTVRSWVSVKQNAQAAGWIVIKLLFPTPLVP